MRAAIPCAVPVGVATIPVICGPTAGGKSDLAVRLAHALRERHGVPAEVVTADAFQVYVGLDIGTAKPTDDERAGVPHHLIDIVDPATGRLTAEINSTGDARADGEYAPFTVDRWLGLAEGLIADLRARGVVPIVVGGTHLYVKALLDGLFDGPEPNPDLRAELAAMAADQRRAELERVDPAAAARIHPNDVRRTVRALEVFRLTGTPISAMQKQWDQPGESGGRGPSAYTLIGLEWSVEALNPRINARVRRMVERGLVEEARRLFETQRLGPQAREALGYKQLIEHFRGRATLEEAIERTKIETRRFAKNQRTWLRRLRMTPGSLWLEAEHAATWVDRTLEHLQADRSTSGKP